MNIEDSFPLMISAVLMPLLLLPLAFSAFNASSPIQNFASIAYMSPLHVEGNKVKDALGNTIYLRGAGIYQYAYDPTGWWYPEGGAWYDNHLVWDENAIRWHMRQMKQWGINSIRFHTVAEWWVEDTVTLEAYTGSYRNNLERTIQIAQDEKLYVIMDLVQIKDGIWYVQNANNVWPHIPFPPYLQYDEEKAIFPSEQAFVDYWASVATRLQGYPNVIFELYNEPCVPSWKTFDVTTARNDWFRAMQDSINAIRNTGASNLILAEWGFAVDPGSDWTAWGTPSMDWIEHANLQDPLGNLFYSAHMYRTNYNPRWYDSYNYTDAYTKMQATQLQYAVDTLNVPVIIGEIGANMYSDNTNILSSGLTELGQELQWARNVFNISNQWGIGYSAWDWTITDQWNLISLKGLPAPSAWGQVLIDSIQAGGTRFPA